MANNNIIVKQQTRPCIVFNNTKRRKAFFHGFTVLSTVAPPSLLNGGHNGGNISNPAAIVELEDGHVMMVYPSDIKFLDSSEQFHDRYWGFYDHEFKTGAADE